MATQETPDLGPFGPILVAVLVVAVIALSWPLSADLAGISMNWIAIILVGIGGLAGTVQGLSESR